MYHLSVLFFLGILAGFSLIFVTFVASSFITSNTIIILLVAIGSIAVILFAFAILFLAIKALLKNSR